MAYNQLLLLVDLLCIGSLVLMLDDEFTTGIACSNLTGAKVSFFYVVYASQIVCLWDKTRFGQYRRGGAATSYMFALLASVDLLRICTFAPLMARGIISTVVVTVILVEKYRPPGCCPEACLVCYPHSPVDNPDKRVKFRVNEICI